MFHTERQNPFVSELLAPSRDTGGGFISQPKKTPMPHQKVAVNDLVKILGVSGNDVRTQGHMACGTGKTMVGLWVTEKLKAKRTLLCEPSLALIAQNLREWRANARGEHPEFLVVCSDQSTVKLNSDDVRVDPSEIPARVTNDPREIATFLRDSTKRRIVISTYHSLALVGQAMKGRATGSFDCTVADEAHRTAGKSDSQFTLIHYPEVIRSRTRLYLTATPKIYEGDSDTMVSMDDESNFGVVGHSLPFSRAIEMGLLTDYRLVVATLPEGFLGSEAFNTIKEQRDAVAQLAVLKAIEKYSLTKILSFHNTVRRAYGFAESLRKVGPKQIPNRPLWVEGVDGKMPSGIRTELLRTFGEARRNSLSLIANCRCLTEGVDIPSIDGVVFFDPKQDGIDIVQAIGRAIRRSTSTKKTIGTIIVPLVVPEGEQGIEFLDRSEYKKISQVMRAMRAHDDRFEQRVRAFFGDYGDRKKMTKEQPPFEIEHSHLSEDIKKALRTKVLSLSLGAVKAVLTESQIIADAMLFYDSNGRLPSANDTSIAPSCGISWASIDNCGRKGQRGLVEGRTLAAILKPLRMKLKPDFTEDEILQSARYHFARYKKLPSQHSTEELEGSLEGERWDVINRCGRFGHRGLTKGRTLAVILEPLREEFGLAERGKRLTEAAILKSARIYYKEFGKVPGSGTKGPVPNMKGETWRAIDAAGVKGKRGLRKGRTLFKILAPLRKEAGKINHLDKGDLRGHKILKAAKHHKKLYGRLPTQKSEEPVYGMENETWCSIHSALYKGSRGLGPDKTTLSKFLDPLRP